MPSVGKCSSIRIVRIDAIIISKPDIVNRGYNYLLAPKL
jgi:hypothetical protein